MLRAALDSLLAQTYTNLEILVQDDSTNDDCEQVVRKYTIPSMKYTHNRPPLGTLHNLLAGYRKSTGKYFATLNDDDLYSPAYLQTMVDALESDSSFAIAFTDHNIIDQSGSVLEPESTNNSYNFGRTELPTGRVGNALQIALISKAVPGMFALYRRDAVDLTNFPDEVSSAYDYWLTYLALRSGASIHYTNARLTSYRVHDASQTSAFATPAERLRYIAYNKFIDSRLLTDELVASVWSPLRARLSETLAAEGFAHLRLNDRDAAASALRQSLAHGSTRKNILGLSLCFVPGFMCRWLLRGR